MMNRRENSRPTILKWFGNMTVFSDFLDAKSWWSMWLPIKTLDTYFRALGVVVFACNPFTGILITIGLVIGNPLIALASFIASVIGTFTCKLLGAPNGDVCNGVAVFNSILFGAVVTAVAPMVLHPIESNIHFWIYLAIGAAITVFVDQGLQSVMAPSRLPVQSVPFNITAAIFLLVLRSKVQGLKLELYHDAETINVNETLIDNFDHFEVIDWFKVLQGTVMATGQIYGIESVKGSVLIWLGYALYSPILAIFLYMGAVIGGFGAVLLTVAPLQEVYIGLWSYNSMLAGGAISFFVVPTPLASLVAVVNAILALSVQAAVTPLFMQTTVPVFSYPFNIAVMLMLAISLRRDSPLQYVENKTFPEEHLCKYYKACGSNSDDFDLSDAETAEALSISGKYGI